MDIDQVKLDSVGKWPSLLSSLGILVGDGRHTCCPVCSPGDPKSDRFRFTNETGRGEWFCSQCDPHAGDGFALIQKVLGVSFVESCKEVARIVGSVALTPHQEEQPVSPDRLRKMFIESKPVSDGDFVSEYLKMRGLKTLPEMLREHPALWEPETKEKFPAMLAVFSQQDGAAVTIHRTYLSEFGNKAPIEKPKKIMPPLKKMTGGAVRLYEPVGDEIGICEGIETAIAIHELMKIPVWAALSATLLEKFKPPKTMKKVLVFGDNDANYTGQKSAYGLAHRLSLEGFGVECHIPAVAGTDFLDDLAAA